MIAVLNTSPTPPSMMEQYTIDGLNRKRCSGCRKQGTMKVLRMLCGNNFPNEQHVLVQCSSTRCSWADAKLHLIFKATPPIQQTVVEIPKPTPLPSLFNDVEMPDLFGGQSKQLPNLF